MRFFTFKHLPRNGDHGIYENRWAFDITLKSGTGRLGVWASMGFYYEIVWNDRMDDPVACEWYEVAFNPDWWALGFSMIWYDGPYNSFSIGPFHFNYRDWKKEPKDSTY